MTSIEDVGLTESTLIKADARKKLAASIPCALRRENFLCSLFVATKNYLILICM